RRSAPARSRPGAARAARDRRCEVGMTAVTAVPSVVVELDGSEIASELGNCLTAVRVGQKLSMPTQCELTFSGAPADAADRFSPGARLKIRTGTSTDALFDGEVTALEYVYEPGNETGLCVRAYDVLHRLRKRQTVRAHVSVTVRDLAEELVADV